ncbi:MAG: adenylyltransferase/cytidyltransferase family protein [Lachnospiraceae bacterium]|nr:adenylyltransferase/cytidyltransferase family protein [Lachnospiraceae bacterium]
MEEKKYKIGYTTGVFDMFHIGHLAILKRAKERCDYLIVGVSSDELVESYKHKQPIVPLEDRMEIVEAIRYVDQVVVQDSMDKFDAWEKYHYDVLFHGDDWKKTAMYDEIEEKLNAVGVDVVFLPHTPGISTTILTEVIKRKKA